MREVGIVGARLRAHEPPSSAKSKENASQPCTLFRGRLSPNCAACHIVDELPLFLAQPVAVLLAPSRHLVPARQAVDVAEVFGTVVLVLSDAQAFMVPGIV